MDQCFYVCELNLSVVLIHLGCDLMIKESKCRLWSSASWELAFGWTSHTPPNLNPAKVTFWTQWHHKGMGQFCGQSLDWVVTGDQGSSWFREGSSFCSRGLKVRREFECTTFDPTQTAWFQKSTSLIISQSTFQVKNGKKIRSYELRRWTIVLL